MLMYAIIVRIKALIRVVHVSPSFYYQSGQCPGAGCGPGRGGEVQPSRPPGSPIASAGASGTHPAVPVTLCQSLLQCL